MLITTLDRSHVDTKQFLVIFSADKYYELQMLPNTTFVAKIIMDKWHDHYVKEIEIGPMWLQTSVSTCRNFVIFILLNCDSRTTLATSIKFNSTMIGEKTGTYRRRYQREAPW